MIKKNRTTGTMEESKKNLKRTRNKNNSSHIINSKLKRRTNQYVLPSFVVLNRNILTVISLLLFCVVSSQCEGLDDLNHHRLHRHSEALHVETADSSSPGHSVNDR